MKYFSWRLSALACVMSVGPGLAGCASEFVKVAPTPPAQYARMASVTGSACGSQGVLATAYYFVPMGVNSRYERAYADALAKAPGATALVDVTASEDWFWWLIGTARCVTITGVAIK